MSLSSPYATSLESLTDENLIAECLGKIGCYLSSRDRNRKREYDRFVTACHYECVRRGREDLWTTAAKEARR
jgi:hypothetical protein